MCSEQWRNNFRVRRRSARRHLHEQASAFSAPRGLCHIPRRRGFRARNVKVEKLLGGKAASPSPRHHSASSAPRVLALVPNKSCTWLNVEGAPMAVRSVPGQFLARHVVPRPCCSESTRSGLRKTALFLALWSRTSEPAVFLFGTLQIPAPHRRTTEAPVHAAPGLPHLHTLRVSVLASKHVASNCPEPGQPTSRPRPTTPPNSC